MRKYCGFSGPATGTTTTAFDALDRITSVTSPGSVTVGYTYDEVGDRTRITYPDTKTVDYTYDGNHRMSTVTDWLTNQTAYTYDDAGKLEVTSYPNGVSATVTYDGADRLTAIDNDNGSTFSSFTYTLDDIGNRTQVVDNAGTTTLQYDDVYRLTQVTYPGPVTDTYTYDANGNRTSRNALTYTYNDADELTSVNGVSYGYDDNGNQVSRDSDGFSFDHENRLTQSVVSGTTSSSVYDGTGVRRSHTVNGSTTTYVWDVNAGLPVVLQDGTRTYVYGLDLISATDGSGNQAYFSYDAVGSVTDLTDGSGTVTDTYVYDVFGTITSHSGPSTNYWLFTGEQIDQATGDTGYYFLRARYYDPTLGRFISRDPLLFEQRYAYAGSNPLLLVDPSGMCVLGIPCPPAVEVIADKVVDTVVGVADAVGSAVDAVTGAVESDCAAALYWASAIMTASIASTSVPGGQAAFAATFVAVVAVAVKLVSDNCPIGSAGGDFLPQTKK
ncbi:MAG: RHS repeat-associated core domain-containing protein [Dehalococcoidia bacterium]